MTTIVAFANAQKSRALHAEGILKAEKTGYHKRQKFGTTIPAAHKVFDDD